MKPQDKDKLNAIISTHIFSPDWKLDNRKVIRLSNAIEEAGFQIVERQTIPNCEHKDTEWKSTTGGTGIYCKDCNKFIH